MEHPAEQRRGEADRPAAPQPVALRAFDPEDEAPITWAETVTAMITEWFFVAWPFWLIGFAGFVVVFARTSVILWTLLSLAISTAFWPARTKWDMFLRSYVLRSWRKYHRFRFVVPKDLANHQRLVLAMFPHGISPVGQIIFASLSDRLFPATFVRGLGASVLFHFPLYRHIMSWLGIVPATKQNLHGILAKGTACVVVGGIAEMFLLDPRREHVKVRSRKGFVKAAIRAGAGLVPVYFFGNSALLSAWSVPGLQAVSRALRMSVIFPFGRFGLAMPFQKPITMVMGDPVTVEQCDNPTDEQVCNTHARFLDALVRTYEAHRHLHPGWEQRPLVLH